MGSNRWLETTEHGATAPVAEAAVDCFAELAARLETAPFQGAHFQNPTLLQSAPFQACLSENTLSPEFSGNTIAVARIMESLQRPRSSRRQDALGPLRLWRCVSTVSCRSYARAGGTLLSDGYRGLPEIAE